MNKRLPLSAGTILQSRYRIVRQLGRGGMGAVYEAVNERVSASVALKETFADDDYTRNAFEREAKMLANMTHEAFPRVIDYFAEGDGYYLVMELIRGKDLAELLQERGAALETEQVLEWGDQILDALEDLHSQNIIHRDIKPSNLKLTPRGRLKLLDFGIAKGTAGDMTVMHSTIGSIAGATLQYAPLEQVLRASPDWYMALSVNFAEKTAEVLEHGTDVRSDLYALGATLYHLLTNTLPVNAPTRTLAVWSGLPDKLRPASEINPKISYPVSAILQKTLEIDREKRPGSAAELRRMLKNYTNEPEVETVPAIKINLPPPPTSPFITQPVIEKIQPVAKRIDNRELFESFQTEEHVASDFMEAFSSSFYLKIGAVVLVCVAGLFLLLVFVTGSQSDPNGAVVNNNLNKNPRPTATAVKSPKQ